ncbi:MAG: hypothetical protein ACKOHH_02010, partial [Bacteroidota bacterium]
MQRLNQCLPYNFYKSRGVYLATFLLGLFLASSCRWGVDMEACYRLQDGDWRGLLTTEGGDLPFLFRVEREA